MAAAALIHPRVLTEIEMQKIAQYREKAHVTVLKLCSGEERFRMTIPANDDDTDIVLIQALENQRRLEQEVYRIRGEIKVMLTENYDMPDEYRAKLMAIIFDGQEYKPRE